jgi:hypothetical protein
MDVLNFISWIKNGQQVTTVDPTQTLLPLGLRDPRRDDGYRSGTITAQDFINQIPVPPSLFETSCGGAKTTVRTGYNSAYYGSDGGVNLAQNSTVWGYYGFIGGGAQHNVYSCENFVGSGIYHTVCAGSSAIVGGQSNLINYSADKSFIGGGCSNYIYACAGTITGGTSNVVSSCYSNVNGGLCNNVNGAYSSIIGGRCNIANCTEVVIAGSCISANRACSTFVNNLSIMNIPTSSAGLPSKAVWSNAGVLTIVP